MPVSRPKAWDDTKFLQDDPFKSDFGREFGRRQWHGQLKRIEDNNHLIQKILKENKMCRIVQEWLGHALMCQDSNGVPVPRKFTVDRHTTNFFINFYCFLGPECPPNPSNRTQALAYLNKERKKRGYRDLVDESRPTIAPKSAPKPLPNLHFKRNANSEGMSKAPQRQQDEQIHYFNVISESLRGSSVRSSVTPSQSDVTPNAHKCASAPQGHVGTEKKEPPPQIMAELPFEEVETEDLELYGNQNFLPPSSNVRGHAQRTAGSPSKHCPSRVSVTIDTSTRRFDTPRPIDSVVDSASKGTVKVSRKGSKRKDVAQAPNSNAVSQAKSKLERALTSSSKAKAKNVPQTSVKKPSKGLKPQESSKPVGDMELLTLTVSASEMAAFAPIEKMPDTEQPPRKTLKEMGLKFNRTNDKSISEVDILVKHPETKPQPKARDLSSPEPNHPEKYQRVSFDSKVAKASSAQVIDSQSIVTSLSYNVEAISKRKRSSTQLRPATGGQAIPGVDDPTAQSGSGNNVEQSGSNSSLTVVGDREGTHRARRKKKKKGNATSAGPLTAPLPESTQQVDIVQKGAKVQERKSRSKQVRRPATSGANVDREVSPSSSLDIPLATRAVKPIEGRPPLPENTARNITTKIKRAKVSTIPEPDLNIVEGRSCPTLKQASPDQSINYPFGDEASPEPYAPTVTEEFHVPAAVDLRDMGDGVRDPKILSPRVTIVTEAVDGLPREPPRITADVAVGMQVIITAPTSGHVNGNPDSLPTAAAMSNPKPPLAQYPPIWAQSRQEVCEAFDWFRSYQGGVYHARDAVRGYLLSAFSSSRDVFKHDGKLIISHGGGKSESIHCQNGLLESHQASDQLADDKSVRALLSNYRDRRPLALVIDDKYALFPFDLTSKRVTYAVLGFYTIAYAWAEYQQANNEAGRVVRYKFAFRWCDDQGTPWWTENPIALPAVVSKGSPSPPTRSRRPLNRAPRIREQHFLSDHALDRPSMPESEHCASCGRMSPKVYPTWVCLQPGCRKFWKYHTDSGESLMAEPLQYNSNFLNLPPPDPLPPGTVLLPYPPTTSTTNGVITGYAFTRGVHCPKCGRLSCKSQWEKLGCMNCPWQMEIPIPIRNARDFWCDRLPVGFSQFSMNSLSDIKPGPSLTFSRDMGRGIIQTFHLPYGRGFIHHIRSVNALGMSEADDVFLQYQQQASTGQLKFRRWPMRAHKCRGALLTNYFSHNAGEPYQYVGGDANTVPFEHAPAVVEARRLIQLRIKQALGRDTEFNEVLSAAYMERQKMAFHSDSEVGLGPLVAGLSLGSPALIHFRLHAKHDPIGERRGILLSIVLRHGDILVMDGSGVQEYYEHTVIPNNFRIAATARQITPIHHQKVKSDTPEHKVTV